MRIKDAANKLELACKEREALEKALDQSQLDNEKAKDDIVIKKK
jgi:hypothetical protein